MGKSKSKAKATPIEDPKAAAARRRAISGLFGLEEAFPMEIFEAIAKPGLEQYMAEAPEYLMQLMREGAFDPEYMEQVFKQTQAPMLALQQRGIRDLLMGQAAAGKARSSTALESMAKQAGGAYAKAWQPMPQLALQDVQARMGAIKQTPETYAAGFKGLLMPEEWKRGLYRDVLTGAATAPTGQRTTTEKPRGQFFGFDIG
jgi:hypothetical protein